MIDNLPTKPAITTPDDAKRSRPGKVGGRLKQCIDAMIWRNLTDNEAAVEFRMHVTSIRKALKLPHVLRYLREQRQVLNARELARNSHVLIDVRDNSANGMARIAAVRELEATAQADERVVQQRPLAPGLTIVVVQQAPTQSQPPGRLITVGADLVGNDVGTPLARLKREENQ